MTPVALSRVESPRFPSLSRSLARRALPGAKLAPFPGFIQPCLALARTEVPTAPGLVHELKLDGYRVQAHICDGRVRLYTRGGFEWTSRFATIVARMTRLPAGKLVLDGEIICADQNGRPDFSALQDDLKRGRDDQFVYYAFDLLHLDGFDTRPAPLLERKRVLQSLLSECQARIFYSEHFEDGTDLYARATEMKLEGIVSKTGNAPYRSGRCEHWLKVKCWRRDRFVVVGFVPEGSSGILKLRLARRERGELIYVGRVGTGWDHETAHAIRRALEPLARPTSPLTVPVKKRDTTWIEPRFDAEVTYLEANDGMLRQPSFKALLRHR
jgi:bifunctional non-homologous end joining protein LigD